MAHLYIMVSPTLQYDFSPYILVNDMSDHLPIVVTLRNQNKSMRGLKTIVHRRLDDITLDKVKENLKQIDLGSELDHKNVNDSFDHFHRILRNSLDLHAPEKSLKMGRKNLIKDPWIIPIILRSLRNRKCSTLNSCWKKTMFPHSITKHIPNMNGPGSTIH